MEGGYDASSTVGNQSLDSREPPQGITDSERIYQQEHAHHQLQSNQSPVEIPAAKVNNWIV